MASCIADVEFIYNEDNESFPQKLIIAGITRDKKSFVKEIVYKFPTQTQKTDNLLCESVQDTVYGRFNFTSKNQDLFECLKQFDFVIVKNKLQSGYIAQFTLDKNKIYVLEE